MPVTFSVGDKVKGLFYPFDPVIPTNVDPSYATGTVTEVTTPPENQKIPSGLAWGDTGSPDQYIHVSPLPDQHPRDGVFLDQWFFGNQVSLVEKAPEKPEGDE